MHGSISVDSILISAQDDMLHSAIDGCSDATQANYIEHCFFFLAGLHRTLLHVQHSLYDFCTTIQLGLPSRSVEWSKIVVSFAVWHSDCKQSYVKYLRTTSYMIVKAYYAFAPRCLPVPCSQGSIDLFLHFLLLTVGSSRESWTPRLLENIYALSGLLGSIYTMIANNVPCSY